MERILASECNGKFTHMFGDRVMYKQQDNEEVKFIGCNNVSGYPKVETFNSYIEYPEWVEGKYNIGERLDRHELLNVIYHKIIYTKNSDDNIQKSGYGHF